VANAAAQLSDQISETFGETLGGINLVIARIAAMPLNPETQKKVAAELADLARQFAQRFGDSRRALERVGRGLEQFERRIVSDNQGSKGW